MRSEHGVYLGMLITFIFSKKTCECVFTKLVASTIPLELDLHKVLIKTITGRVKERDAREEQPPAHIKILSEFTQEVFAYTREQNFIQSRRVL